MKQLGKFVIVYAAASMELKLDFRRLVAGLSHINSDEKEAVTWLRSLHESGEVGFLNLPDDQALASSVEEYSTKQELSHVVVLGIGGSSLGARTLYNGLSRGRRSIRFVDNIVPSLIEQLRRTTDLSQTLFSVVTKSGSTAETIAQFLHVHSWLESEGLDPKKHIVVTTDPAQGALRQLCQEKSFHSFEVPPNVGGRFSVLSAVGLLPAALCGIDCGELLRGARDMKERCMAPSAKENPALALSQLMASHAGSGRLLTTLFCYDDGLRAFAEWFAQLWGESLGKKTEEGTSVGLTPLIARGVTDQHSQLQLYAEGPDDKTYLFLKTAHRADAVIANTPLSRRDEFSYLHNIGFGRLFDAEYRGTVDALSESHRPIGEILIPRVDEYAMGQLFVLFECAAAYTGYFLRVDPFNQPGVERAKKLAFHALGREGYTESATPPEWTDYALPSAHLLF